jgi:hypothetical protein
MSITVTPIGDARDVCLDALRDLATELVDSVSRNEHLAASRLRDAGLVVGWIDGRSHPTFDGMDLEVLEPLARSAEFQAAEHADDLRWLESEFAEGILLPGDDRRDEVRASLARAQRVLAEAERAIGQKGAES